MRHIRASDYRIMPWKNGGGSTTELAISPEGSGVSSRPFLWRVSIADVIADGPFSHFPGYDRHIMVIGGAGMVLETREQGEIDLTVPFRPVTFSGDWTAYGRLAQGPVRDFNLMVARSFARSELAVEILDARRRFGRNGTVQVLHLLEGEVSANGHIIGTSETVVLGEGEAAEMAPLDQPARLAICRISTLWQ